MEFSSWPESLQSHRMKAIQELTKGQILTDKLRELLDEPAKIETDLMSVNGMVEQILGLFDSTLSILSPSNFNKIPYNPTWDIRSTNCQNVHKAENSSESIKTKALVRTKRGCYKRRKHASSVTKVTSTLIDDGYAWRKYGQKVIQNSKHQRNYYRCSHKFEQGCQATKQVQKTDGEPSKYRITYNGLHTCNNLQMAPQIIVEASKPMDNSTLISFESHTLREDNKAGNCFSLMQCTPKEGFSTLGDVKHKQVSSYDHHAPWDVIVGLSQVPSEPMSMMSSGLDREEMVSSGEFSSKYSTHGYDIDEISGFDDFVFE
ncbi:hypothetical protein R6Q59_026322 [Mikania micrantha]|uniref:WRKY domain-containing protein n=1 Tax=Mikania micrantha TaxID=192012 RepID=A0A5N6PFS9_9ASTR|nr:hypothetical protein E3N88_11555 [Mikania micrantha]